MLEDHEYDEINKRINKAFDYRQQRGFAIASGAAVKTLESGKRWVVPSQNKNEVPKKRYQVSNDTGRFRCDCEDFRKQALWCKHIWGVQFYRLKEQARVEEGSGTKGRNRVERRAPRVWRDKRDWSKYRAGLRAQSPGFLNLLVDLLDNVDIHTPRKRGQQIDWRSAAIAIVMKVYEEKSADRFVGNLNVLADKGLIEADIHPNTVLNYMNHPEMEHILKSAISVSSYPLHEFEDVLAIDSTGFTGSERIPFYDYKYMGATQTRYITAHMACGVKTKIVAAVEVISAADSQVFPTLFREAIQRLAVREVVADKAYSTDDVYEVVRRAGITPYIEHKMSHTGQKTGDAFRDSLRFFRQNPEVFYQHYNKRSNVESLFSMMKHNHGATIKSKTTQAMKNEVLCKVLCHNICRLISAKVELGAVLTEFRKTVH